jgi:hypothetical protein
MTYQEILPKILAEYSHPLQVGDECNIMTFEKAEYTNYTFKYVEAKEGLELHLGYCSSEKDLKILIDGQELEYEILKQELIVYVPYEFSSTLSDVFEIVLYYGDKKILQ